MAQQIYGFVVTVPANTPESDNWSEQINTPPFNVDTIEIRIPPGPRGQMGFALGGSGTPVLPQQAGEFIVTDDEKITWSLTDQMDSGAWEVFAYNTGRLSHDIYIRLIGDSTAGASTTAVPDPISADALTG